MQPPADRPSPLSVHRAFVVQFRAETDIARGCVVGRIEHVTSGQATQFDSLTALLTFIRRILSQELGERSS